jgi:cytosine/adenosine deaminase-related metal-dependent hydrolase
MDVIAGEILLENGFQKGFISIDENRSVRVDMGSSSIPPKHKGLIIPLLVNAHTHLGDAFIRKKNIPLPKDVKTLVGPPSGLKHRLLENTSEVIIKQGMKDAIQEMRECGTSVFLDFRENGINGTLLLREVSQHTAIKPIIFGRPSHLSFDENELRDLFQYVDGIGISSISDWDENHLDSLVSLTKKHNIPIALHASESKREDIEKILSLQPSFLVHMTKAEKKDLIQVKKHEIPIVVCPRSNAFFGLKPPLQLMKQLHIDILIGTDNAMLHSTCILDEIRFILKEFPNIFSRDELLYMGTFGARKALNLLDGISGANFPSSFMVLDPKSLQQISTVVC